MREQLIRYIDLLFAGAPDADDVKQEILQNTLDRYDDLVEQGKAPQAAYSLAISGIGDIGEILNREPAAAVEFQEETRYEVHGTPSWKKIVRAGAVFLYIICAIPLIVLSEMGMDILGLCGTISIAAVATVAILVSSDDKKRVEQDEQTTRKNSTPKQEMKKAVRNAISTAGLVIYLIVSFATGAWHITWLIFPMISAVQGIVNAATDLREAK